MRPEFCEKNEKNNRLKLGGGRSHKKVVHFTAAVPLQMVKGA
jgi:hypothetical protein